MSDNMNHLIYIEFDKKMHEPNGKDTYKWEEHDLDLAKVLSHNMLVKDISTQNSEKGPNAVETVSVYLCYNWRLKAEFILVRQMTATTSYNYEAQYGRDDNYNKSERRDYQFHSFSVEAFKHDRPELASCLENI